MAIAVAARGVVVGEGSWVVAAGIEADSVVRGLGDEVDIQGGNVFIGDAMDNLRYKENVRVY